MFSIFDFEELKNGNSFEKLLSLMAYTPILDKEVKGEFVGRTEPIHLLGCKPVWPEDLVHQMLDQTNQEYLESVGMTAGICRTNLIGSTTKKIKNHYNSSLYKFTKQK